MRLPTVSPSEANAIEDRIERLLASWDGTKYMSGQQCKGVHADCIGFVFGHIDELYYRPSPTRDVLPPDTSMHSRSSAIAAMHTLLRLYQPVSAVTDGTMEPGDVIVTGHTHGGPGHIWTVGGRRNTIWHCTNLWGVIQSGMGFAHEFQTIFGVYRFDDREKWLPQ